MEGGFNKSKLILIREVPPLVPIKKKKGGSYFEGACFSVGLGGKASFHLFQATFGSFVQVWSFLGRGYRFYIMLCCWLEGEWG